MVEVLVSIVITALLGSMVMMFFLTAVRTTRAADGRNEQSASGRSIIDSWAMLAAQAANVQGESAPDKGQRFVSILPREAMFCIALDMKADARADDPRVPMGVRITLEDGQLIEYRWSSCDVMRSAPPGNYSVRRVLAPRAALVAPNAWLVTPLSANDLTASSVVDGNAVPSSLITDGTASLTELQSTVGVRIAFQTLPDPRRPAPIATYSTIALLETGH